jgi:hypothetical protein
MVGIKLKNNSLLFVHIPKTGGTSILKKIDQSVWKKVIYAGHDPLFTLQSNNDIRNAFSFCVVRNPYRRTFSYYNHFKRQNKVECSFLHFLELIKKKIFFEKTPMIVFPQSFYVYDLNSTISIGKIYKYENFIELENDLNIKFDRLNVGNYSDLDYENAYKNQEVLDLVQELFSIDFVNFNYRYDVL